MRLEKPFIFLFSFFVSSLPSSPPYSPIASPPLQNMPVAVDRLKDEAEAKNGGEGERRRQRL
jgi:hypothetical protein